MSAGTSDLIFIVQYVKKGYPNTEAFPSIIPLPLTLHSLSLTLLLPIYTFSNFPDPSPSSSLASYFPFLSVSLPYSFPPFSSCHCFTWLSSPLSPLPCFCCHLLPVSCFSLPPDLLSPPLPLLTGALTNNITSSVWATLSCQQNNIKSMEIKSNQV